MSWSVQATGKGQALVDELTRQFDASAAHCSNIPQEQETVLKVKEAVIAAVKDVTQMVSVNANGSAWREGDVLKNNTFSVSMTNHYQVFVDSDTNTTS